MERRMTSLFGGGGGAPSGGRGEVLGGTRFADFGDLVAHDVVVVDRNDSKYKTLCVEAGGDLQECASLHQPDRHHCK